MPPLKPVYLYRRLFRWAVALRSRHSPAVEAEEGALVQPVLGQVLAENNQPLRPEAQRLSAC